MNTRTTTIIITLALLAMTLAPITPVGAAPIITDVNPTSGTANGGTTVALTGTGFVDGATVTVGGKLASGIAVSGTTSISFKTPSGAPGAAATIVVTNPGGQTFAFNNAFTYQTPSTALAVDAVSPGSGPANGGTTLTITGSGFHTDPRPRVLVGGTPAIVTGATATEIKALAPPSTSTGAVSILVRNPSQGLGSITNQEDTLAANFLYTAAPNAPTITSVNPLQGSTDGGTSVVITGTNFAPGVSVTFDGVLAPSVIINSVTQITVTSPVHAVAATVPLVVTNPDGSTVASTFTYSGGLATAPTVSKIDPPQGPVIGGTILTITGTGFHPDVEVTVAGTPVDADDVTFDSASQLRVKMPPGTAGAAAVAVKNPATSSVAAGSFTYIVQVAILSVSPNVGPSIGGTTVTLTGSGFQSGARVFFGDVQAHLVNYTGIPTALTMKAPSQAAGAVNIRVVNPDGTGARINGAFSYSSSSDPTISDTIGVSPTTGGSNGGISLTITGTGFAVPVCTLTSINPDVFAPGGCTGADPKPTVKIGTNTVPPHQVTVNSEISITVIVPARTSTTTATNVLVQVTNPDGKSSASATCGTADPAPNRCFRYTSNAAPERGAAMLPTNTGGSNGGLQITIAGTGFATGAHKPTVAFGSVVVPADHVTVNSDILITVKVPARPSTTSAANVDVKVTNPDGKNLAGSVSCGSASPPPNGCFRYTVADQPSISTIGSDSGPAIGGPAGSVTLGGSFFAFAAAPNAPAKPVVKFGDKVVPENLVVVNSDESITVTPPGGAPGGVTITVTNPDGKSAVTAAGAYTYTSGAGPTLSGVAPSTGPTIGGTTITLSGTGFAAHGASKPIVSIGGTVVPADDVTVVSSTSMTVKVPARAAGTVSLLVTNPDNQAAGLGNAFRYFGALPEITGIVVGGSGNSASANGGAAMAINGADLPTSNPSVRVGASLATITATSAAKIDVILPPESAGLTSVFVVDRDGQTATHFNGLAYTAATQPTFTDIMPRIGSVNGGALVKVTGQNFAPGVTVEVMDCRGAGQDRFATGVSTSSDGKELTFAAPQCLLGPKEIVIVNPNTLSLTLPSEVGGAGIRFGPTFGYTSLIGPTLSSITPLAGSTGGGTSITLNGANFLPASTVMVGGNPATNVVFVSSTQLTATTPAGSVGPADVTVTNPNTLSASLPGGFTYSAGPQPTLTKVEPDSGGANGGTLVELQGTNFVQGATVMFGTAAATGVTVNSATKITATTPAGTVGPVTVTVKNPDNLEGSLPSGFTYTAAPAPLFAATDAIDPVVGISTGGTVVTLKGTGFAQGATVLFGGTPATNVQVTAGTTITATTPGHASGAVDVVVRNPDGQVTDPAVTFTFEAAPAPTLTSIAPQSGTASGGTTVVLTGTGFAAGATVRIGGAAATGVVVNSPTQITAVTPGGTVGARDVVVRNSDGQNDTLAGGFSYTPTARLITPTIIRDANQAVLDSTGVEKDADGVAVTWDPSMVPSDAAGVQIWRINSPAVWIADVLTGTAAFDAGRFVDPDGTKDSRYHVTVFFGQELVLGYSTSSITDLPGFDSFTEQEVEDYATPSLAMQESIFRTWWFWLLIILAILVLGGLVVLAIVMTRRGGEEADTAAPEWGNQEDLGWAEGEGGDLDLAGDDDAGSMAAGGPVDTWQDEEPPAGVAAAAGVHQQADPLDAEVHYMECPQCGDQFSAVGEKPLVTTCPGCGTRGVLR